MADRKFTMLVMTLLLVANVDVGDFQTLEETEEDAGTGNFFTNVIRCHRAGDPGDTGEMTSPDCDLHCSPRPGRCVTFKVSWGSDERQLLTCECSSSLTSTVPSTEWSTSESPAYPTTPSPELTTTLDSSLTSPPSLEEDSAVDANVSQECVSVETCSTFCQTLGRTAGVCDMGYLDPSTHVIQVPCLCTTGDPASTVPPPATAAAPTAPPPTATPARPRAFTIRVYIRYWDPLCSRFVNGRPSQCINFCVAHGFHGGICVMIIQLNNRPVTAKVFCLCILYIRVRPPRPSSWPTFTWHMTTDWVTAETPGYTSSPETPGYPGSTETTGYPSSPETPGYPGSTETTGYPSSPETPGYPSSPETPGYPSSPETPGYPGSTETPDYPSSPDTPGYPSSSDTPGYPSSPETPGYPSSPETPGYPSSPETPGYPSSPETPGYPS